MRLRTRLVVATAAVTFTIVVLLSGLFLAELLRQRIGQTSAANDVIAQQVRLMTQQALLTGVAAEPDKPLRTAVTDALAHSQPLRQMMDASVRYSPSVQDVSITDAQGRTLLASDPLALEQPQAARLSFDTLRDGWAGRQLMEVFGPARVLDVAAPLDRNGAPFLIVHVGVRSSFLKNAYIPGLRSGLLLTLLCGALTMLAAALLTSVALRPITAIEGQLRQLKTGHALALEAPGGKRGSDPVGRVTASIEQLGQQVRTAEEGYTNLQARVDRMLDTLRDGILMLTVEGRVAMASDAVQNFLPGRSRPLVGLTLAEALGRDTAIGTAVLWAFGMGQHAAHEHVRTEDGREVEFALDRLEDDTGRGIGTLLTLRDAGSARQLSQELEVSRRLAAVGRLTVGVGHEVKNPINAMVVHLELLKAKLEAAESRGEAVGAQRHVDVLTGEMARLDRVVQTLADFTRPIELKLADVRLDELVESVLELTAGELTEHDVDWDLSLQPVIVRADSELLRQALLNLVLNGMQAMPDGGRLRLHVGQVGDEAVIDVADDGQGIAPEALPRIFDLYFTTKPRGTGVGLAMTYRILQMHGGSIDVASEPGHGATFTIHLQAEPGSTQEARRA